MKKAHHPAAALFPMMGPAELKLLARDIERYGLHEPIVLLNGKVIDGRNRLAACNMAGVPPRFREFGEGHNEFVPLHFVVTANLHRRHLDANQRAKIGIEVKQQLAEEAKARQKKAGGDKVSPKARGKALVEPVPQALGEPYTEPESDESRASNQAGKLVGVSGRTIRDRELILKEGGEELNQQVDAGEVSIKAAAAKVRGARTAEQPPADAPMKRAVRQPTPFLRRHTMDAVGEVESLFHAMGAEKQVKPLIDQLRQLIRSLK